MSLDPLLPTLQDSCTPGNPDATAYRPSFVGASFENNHFWTGPNTHYVIGQAVGSAAWFMSQTYGAYTGKGGNITGNDNNNIPTYEGTGILVAGINNARVQGNLGNRVPVSTTCSAVAGDVVVADNVASGNDVQLHSDVYLAGTCLGESSPPPAIVWPGA